MLASEMLEFEHETRAAPLHLFKLRGAAESPAELQAFLDLLERLYDRGEPFADVWDLRRIGSLGRETREYLTGWLAANRWRIGRVVVATAVVVNTAPARELMGSLFRIQPPAAGAYESFLSIPHAIDWAARQLDTAGASAPPRELDLLRQRLSAETENRGRTG